MKCHHLRDFEKYLEASSSQALANIYLILAKDPFQSKNALDLLRHFLLRHLKSPEIALKSYDGEQLIMNRLLEDLEEGSFLSDQHMIVVHQVDKLSKSNCGKLESCFRTLPSFVYLVLTATTLHKSSSLASKAEQSGVVLEIPELKPWEKEKAIQEWICLWVLKMGKKIEPKNSLFLLKRVGTDQAILQQELEKLICYIGDRNEMTSEDIKLICGSINQETNWKLGEAIFRRDIKAALPIARALLDDQVPFLTLLRQVRHQVQTEYQVCSILENGGKSAEVTHQFPYMKGQILKSHLELSRFYGMSRFKAAMIKIDEIELLAKNSALEPELLVELLVCHLVL